MRNSTYPDPRPAASLLKYGSTPSSSVYQRAAAGRSSAHRVIVLIPRSMVFPSPSAIGSQKIPATSGKTGSNADSAAFPGLHEIQDDGLPHPPGPQRLIPCPPLAPAHTNPQPPPPP